jgi:cytochrome c55X
MKCRVWPLFSLLLAADCGLAAGISDPRQAELLNMLKHDCGSCHGLTLRGGLGPALHPESLAGKPADYLAATILYGRPGTPMPPWRPFLSPQEAAWMAERMREGVK